jgi:asparagine synthase (glutamine-hydrolysing)
MCGIAGYIGKRFIDEKQIERTLVLMRNRGPDSQDYRVIRDGDTSIILLHSRLSIIDLDRRSNQPFTIGDTTIVYNGEIYNYVELKKELQGKGVQFVTNSDTEVLLQCYRCYGERCVEYLEGMWAFAIFDTRKGKLFLSRDRFAEKPLYYFSDNDGFYFGSEIKFIKELSAVKFAVNDTQIIRYLVNGYKSLYKKDETYFKGVKELGYASNMTIDRKGLTSTSRYWKPECSIADGMSMEEAIEGSKYHLLESMRIRLRSDVPLAFCLSGGVDSATLVSIAAKEFNYNVAAFSIIDSDERYNELDNIMATVQDIGCECTLINLSYENFLEQLRDLILYHDVPVATITYYIHSLLSRSIAEKGYRVAFSGTSADELFTGYYDHFLLHLWEVRKHKHYTRWLEDWQKYTSNYIRNPLLKDPDLYTISPNAREHVFDNSREFLDYLLVGFSEEFTEEFFCDSLLRNRMINELFHEATRVILHEDDLNSMFYSIENRSPYLDSRLFNFMYSVPSEHLIKEGYAKYLLRESMRGILNDHVRLDRRKRGFNASINSLVDFNDKEVIGYLLDERARVFDILDRSKVERLFSLDPVPNHYSKFIFSFINARIFLELQ